MRRAGLAVRVAVLGAMALAGGAEAWASTAAVMTLEGTASGAADSVTGNKVKKGSPAPAATQIELLSVTRNGGDAAASGSAMGKRGPANVVVTKAYDASSAILEQGAAVNQIFREVTIVFETSGVVLGAAGGKGSAPKGATAKGSSKADSRGASVDAGSKTAQELVLKNAQITEIVQTRNMQRITIEYQSVEVTNPAGKAVATDDWETP